MIKRLFTNTAEWAHKHWLAVAVILLLLFLLDGLFFFLFSLFSGINKLAGKLFPASAVDIGKALTSYYNWAHDDPWLFAASLVLLFPAVGWIAFAWLIIERIKIKIFGPDVILTQTANPIPPAGPEQSNNRENIFP